MDYYVQITGSIPKSNGKDVIALTTEVAGEVAKALMNEGIGVVALVGASQNEETVPFDDEIVKAAAEYVRDAAPTGIVIRTVRNRDKWLQRVALETQSHLEQLRDHIEDEALAAKDATGGEGIRPAQARAADGAIVIGGTTGVYNTARLLMAETPPKPVDEIRVKGLTGGLDDTTRDQLEEHRNWVSRAENRTVFQRSDISRVARSTAVQMAKELVARQTAIADAVSNENADNESPRQPWPKKVRHSAMSATTAAWANVVTGITRLILRTTGGGNEP